MTTPSPVSPHALRHALRWRLPLLILSVVVPVLAAFTFLSYREVARTLRQGAGLRLVNASDQLASLLAAQTQQRLGELRRIAAMPELRTVLQQPDEQTRQAAAQQLTTAFRASMMHQVVEIWNANGQRIVAVAMPPGAEDEGPPSRPPTAEAARLREHNGIVYSETALPVGEAAAGAPAGFIVVRRPAQFSGSTDVINRLVGTNSAIAFGNRDDDLWINSTGRTSPPPRDRSPAGIADYTAADGTRRLGALAEIRGTSLGVWVEFPEAVVVAPAQRVLGSMLMLSAVLVVGTTLFAAAATTRITRPLKETGDLLEAQIHELEESRLQLDQFFSLSLDLLCIADEEGRLRRVNPAWTETLGWTERELTSGPYLEFIHPDDFEATAEQAAKLAEGQQTVKFENRWRCKDGSYRWLSWKAAPHGRGLIYAAARDVTEEKRVARELEAHAHEFRLARVEAERGSQAKSEFLSRMSHDLRTPLNAILGFAQLLEMDVRNEDQIDNVRHILNAGRHLLDMINDVLDIARIESGRLSLSPEPVLVKMVVQRAVELVTPLAANRGVSLDRGAVPDHVTVIADRQRLIQILLNLLSNAVKYNRLGGRISVGYEQHPTNRCRVTVTDTGGGIPAAKLALLFQPFERLGAEQTAVEGTGLGLALSRALAEAMGGTIGVDSAVDRGSTFWVELPIADVALEPESVLPLETADSASPDDAAGTILYIEDNVSNVRLMERILQRRPNIVLRHAAHADAALAVIEEHRPDLILLDLHLPDVSGDEVLRRLQENPATRPIPVVIVTADATPGLSRRLHAAGAVAFLTKPLKITHVLELVDDRLTRHPEQSDA